MKIKKGKNSYIYKEIFYLLNMILFLFFLNFAENFNFIKLDRNYAKLEFLLFTRYSKKLCEI